MRFVELRIHYLELFGDIRQLAAINKVFTGFSILPLGKELTGYQGEEYDDNDIQ